MHVSRASDIAIDIASGGDSTVCSLSDDKNKSDRCQLPDFDRLVVIILLM